MSSRASLRRKVVLPVTVVRHDGQEKQLAHTLDVTGTSARLGGLASMLEAGEIIELQRGAVKARFQVVWMGAQGGAMAGQAGVRGLDPNKPIWNIDLPEDEVDITVDAANLRHPMPPVHSLAKFPGEKRWHPRYACSGSVSIRTAGAAFAMNGEVKDISQGGVYIELSATLPVNSNVNLALCVENVRFETAGTVRTSYPLLGMGVCFQNLTPENAEKLFIVLERAKRKATREDSLALHDGSDLTAATKTPLSVAGTEENPAAMLLHACQLLAEDFDRWANSSSKAEIEALKAAISELQQKLSQPRSGFMEYTPASATNSKTM